MLGLTTMVVSALAFILLCTQARRPADQARERWRLLVALLAAGALAVVLTAVVDDQADVPFVGVWALALGTGAAAVSAGCLLVRRELSVTALVMGLVFTNAGLTWLYRSIA